MNGKKGMALLLCCVLICGGLCGCAQKYGDRVEYTMPWGTPIVGGIKAVYSVAHGTTNKEGRQVKEVFEKRLEAWDVTDYEVQYDAAQRQVTVTFSGNESDCKSIAQKLGMSYRISFHLGDEKDDQGCPTGKLVLDSDDVAEADSAFTMNGSYVVVTKFTESGKAAFAKATEQQTASNGTISIWVDYGETWSKENNTPRYQMVSNPTVNEAITNGEVAITGASSYEEIEELAEMLKVGQLPVEVTLADYAITSTPLLDFARWLHQE